MAFTVGFTVGAPCAGDNHFPVTATRVEVPAQTLTITITKSQATAALSAQERIDFLTLLVRFLLSQGGSATGAQLKAAIEAKVVNLTLPGF